MLLQALMASLGHCLSLYTDIMGQGLFVIVGEVEIMMCHHAKVIVTRSREMSCMSKIFYFEISTPLSGNPKTLHFNANPIRIGHLVPEL